MRLVYKFILKDKNAATQLLELCKVSKCLYNQALYVINQSITNDNKWLFYNDLDKIMKTTYNLENEINYRLLPAKVSQQCLMQLDKNVKSYIRSIKDYSKNPSKYKGKPKMPNYKKTVNSLLYTNQQAKITKDGYIQFRKGFLVEIPQWNKYRSDLMNMQQVRVNPLYNGKIIEIEIVYLKECDSNVVGSGIAGIDLGLNNFVTMVTSVDKPILINGKGIKSYNQFFNKCLSKTKSELDLVNCKKSSNKVRQLYVKRDNYLNDIYHKVSRFIVNYCVKNGIGTIAVGLNKGWKDSINIGNKNNQAFCDIAHSKFIDMLTYKCEMSGIKISVHEESYTSKCDALALEKIEKHETYMGKRVKRGLFQSSVGKLINADVNGALNIAIKVFGDSGLIHQIINSGFLYNPVKFNNVVKLCC